MKNLLFFYRFARCYIDVKFDFNKICNDICNDILRLFISFSRHMYAYIIILNKC